MNAACPILFAAMLAFVTCASAKDVEIRVEGTKSRQIYEGFGATTLSLVHAGQLGDTLGPQLRTKALDALYGQVKLSMGNLAIGLLESPAGWDHRSNDNDDPQAVHWKGFDTFQADCMWNSVVKPAAALGLENYSLEGKINWNWGSPWLREMYRTDRERCLDECAEQVEASVTYWRKIAGSVPRYIHLFNEPTSGNCEIADADAEMVRDIVKRAGDRLRAAGFNELKFVVPNEETVERSLKVAQVILEDTDARKYVAAVGYHVYPYGSSYASVPQILGASASGRRDTASVEQRRHLRDLCRQYGVPVWMTEVSHAEVDPRSFDHLRGRAIHIHDEMVYADASAFYGMNAMWDKKTHAEHFAGRGGEVPNAYLTEEDTIVLADNDANTVLITGMGYAIGHYARWLNRGAVRLEAHSDDNLVLVTALKDEKTRSAVLVIVNNAPDDRTLAISISDLPVQGQVTGEQSYGHARWEAREPVAVESNQEIRTVVRAMSVTTLCVQATVQHDNASGDDIAGVQVALPLPLFNRNQGNIVAADAGLIAAQRNAKRVQLSLQNRLAEVFRQHANARQQVEKYRGTILPDAKETLDLVTSGYQQGEFGYLNLLTAQRTYLQSNLAYLKSLLQLKSNNAQIEGLLLSESLNGSSEQQGNR